MCQASRQLNSSICDQSRCETSIFAVFDFILVVTHLKSFKQKQSKTTITATNGLVSFPWTQAGLLKCGIEVCQVFSLEIGDWHAPRPQVGCECPGRKRERERESIGPRKDHDIFRVQSHRQSDTHTHIYIYIYHIYIYREISKSDMVERPRYLSPRKRWCEIETPDQMSAEANVTYFDHNCVPGSPIPDLDPFGPKFQLCWKAVLQEHADHPQQARRLGRHLLRCSLETNTFAKLAGCWRSWMH